MRCALVGCGRVGLISTVVAVCVAFAAEHGSADDNSKSSRVVSPERVLKRFVVALLAGDRKALEENCVAHDGLEILLTGDRPPAAALSMIRQQLEKSRVRDHAAGEVIKMPNGSTFTVAPDLVADGRKLMSLGSMPIPMSLVQVDGQWKVDPTPIVEARKAAAKKKE